MDEREGVSRRTFLRSAGTAGALLAASTSCRAASPEPQAPGAAAGATAGPGSAAPTPTPTSTTTATPGTLRDELPRPDAGARRRVVVIGAGLAGLTAALDLEAQGWDVVVLEARSRAGGRVHTLTAPFSDGVHVEAGGESIDDNHTSILALVDRFGMQTERRPADKLLTAQVFRDGRRRPIADLLGARNGKALADYTRAGEELSALAEDLDPEHPERVTGAERLDARSLASFLDDLDLVPEARFLFETENRGEYNAELDQVSLLFALQQEAVLRDVPEEASETMRIAGGNSRLIDAMRSELASRVELGAPVTQVAWGDDGVRVTTPTRTVDAARLVVAVPTPPLRRITFSPALPGALGQAIAEVDLGTAVKVATEYRQRFWHDLSTAGFTLTDLPFHIAWSATDSSGTASDPGVLSQFITGRSAADAAGLADAERMRVFGAQLDEVYPEGVEQRTGAVATVAWANEEFTGGGYTVFGPGQMLSSWPAIRRGIGPISFAGEHTEALAGFMESAVRSGHRVARAIGAPPP